MGDKDPDNAKKEQVIEQQSYLSDDLIIEEILTKLPIKSILRFKSVSKQWYSTLSSSDFANSHLKKSPFSHPSAPVNTLFIIDFSNCCYLFSYDDDDDQISGSFEDNLVKLDVDFGVGKDHLMLTGCCNGLVCLTPPSNEYFIIWNPATCKLHKYASHGYLKPLDIADCFVVNSGFGYASSVDDYKYVEILSVQENTNTYIVRIFSLRENRWRKIDPLPDHLFLFTPGVIVGENLYWSGFRNEDGKLVVRFDLGVERFDLIKIDGDRFDDLLGVMRGCLSKYSCRDKLLHIMEPPVIVKSIGLPKGLRLDVFSEMIGFTKTDKIFMTGPFSGEERDLYSRSRMLGIVDTCTKPMKYRMFLRFKDLIKIARYVPSLVSPFPIEEPSKA